MVSGKAGQPILAGFGMPRLAVHLQDALKAHVRGADLSTVVAKSAREPMYPSQVLRKKGFVGIDNFAIDRVWHENSQDEQSEEERKLCLRSWLSAIAADAAFGEVERVRKVDTRYLSVASLACFRLLLSQSDALEKSKPREMVSEFGEHRLEDGNSITLQNARYKTRIRRSNQAQVVMTNAAGEEFIGSAKASAGKQTSIKVARGFKGVLANVRIVGREERNNAEKCREELILLSLQGDAHLPHSPFIELLWFPKVKHVQAACDEPSSHSIRLEGIPLNPSQQRVVAAMTCKSTCLMTTHGPPGTGKTSTIAASAKIWTEQRKPTWIVAHSNVAVKNIAEKLASTRIDFKLIVSKEFFVEWHEHLYHLIEGNTIRADELPKRPQEVQRIFDNCNIVLSTLSMLSNPAFDQNGMFSIVPVERLVVDEASQINIFEYMHLFWKFRADLKKVCFFGDPKQLAPFGSDTTPSLQSIFQLRHFQKAAFFLDVQYRMPTPLGDFISQAVYSNRLRSQHSVVLPSAVAFVDVRGHEEKSGFSWVNERELQTMIMLVANYYKALDFCIITPYDAQRTAIENALKRSNLPWGKVFNIDSFQGE
ncbi:P-loop containing nucleoside triphosphate hydrolase protein [Hymenopellis radicata]|nr:P-loop containing nucleoside triphosphate hydrolase protein [Hymenopellis radicata]